MGVVPEWARFCAAGPEELGRLQVMVLRFRCHTQTGDAGGGPSEGAAAIYRRRRQPVIAGMAKPSPRCYLSSSNDEAEESHAVGG